MNNSKTQPTRQTYIETIKSVRSKIEPFLSSLMNERNKTTSDFCKRQCTGVRRTHSPDSSTIGQTTNGCGICLPNNIYDSSSSCTSVDSAEENDHTKRMTFGLYHGDPSGRNGYDHNRGTRRTDHGFPGGNHSTAQVGQNNNDTGSASEEGGDSSTAGPNPYPASSGSSSSIGMAQRVPFFWRSHPHLKKRLNEKTDENNDRVLELYEMDRVASFNEGSQIQFRQVSSRISSAVLSTTSPPPPPPPPSHRPVSVSPTKQRALKYDAKDQIPMAEEDDKEETQTPPEEDKLPLDSEVDNEDDEDKRINDIDHDSDGSDVRNDNDEGESERGGVPSSVAESNVTWATQMTGGSSETSAPVVPTVAEGRNTSEDDIRVVDDGTGFPNASDDNTRKSASFTPTLTASLSAASSSALVSVSSGDSEESVEAAPSEASTTTTVAAERMKEKIENSKHQRSSSQRIWPNLGTALSSTREVWMIEPTSPVAKEDVGGAVDLKDSLAKRVDENDVMWDQVPQFGSEMTHTQQRNSRKNENIRLSLQPIQLEDDNGWVEF